MASAGDLALAVRAGPRALVHRLSVVGIAMDESDELRSRLAALDLAADRDRGPGEPGAPSTEQVFLLAREWSARRFDPQVLDARAARAPDEFELVLDASGLQAPALALVVVQVSIRCQRFFDTRNRASRSAAFEHALTRHRALHDTRLPLVAADLAHALDVREWMLRLEPEAGVAAQLAALFHDVERLSTEPLVRIEQHAPDYLRFKLDHARVGARIAVAALVACGFEDAVLARVEELVRSHEVPGDDPELLLLNDADALSFFSLNSPGFADYYGPEHTRRKVRYTVARTSPRARAALARVRLRDDVERLVLEELAGDCSFEDARRSARDETGSLRPARSRVRGEGSRRSRSRRGATHRGHDR